MEGNNAKKGTACVIYQSLACILFMNFTWRIFTRICDSQTGKEQRAKKNIKLVKAGIEDLNDIIINYPPALKLLHGTRVSNPSPLPM
jgi:hypothetical protein